MEITISVPDDVGREINSQHNRDYLELPELIRMLEKYKDSSKVSSAPIKQKVTVQPPHLIVIPAKAGIQ